MTWDIAFFRALNGLGSPSLDPWMSALSARALAVPLAGTAFALQAHLCGWRSAARTALLVAAAVVLADSTCHLVKVLVERVRPCGALVDVHLVGGCPSSLSMPSAHAANAPAAATTWGPSLPRPARWIGYAVAALVCVSRVYLGVHYPSDVLVGATIGVGYGLLLNAWRARGEGA